MSGDEREPVSLDLFNQSGGDDVYHTLDRTNNHAVVIPIQDGRGLEQRQNGLGVGGDGDPSYTLTATGGASVAVAFDEYNFTTSEKHQTLRAGTPQSTGVLQPVVFEPGAMSRIDGHDPSEVSPTLRAQMGDNQVAVFYEEPATPTGNLTPWPEMGQPNMVYRTDTVTRTVDNNRHNILTTISLDLRNATRAPDSEQGVGIGEEGDPSHTLTVGATHGVFAEMGEAKSVYENQRSELRETDVTNALSTGGGKPGQGYPAVRVRSVVRRLTPTECERLQGFPDGHTATRGDDKPQADTHRYKQMGNAVAVPVVEWVIAGIVGVHGRND